MGRFYKTAHPQFVDRNIYTPPAELMAKVIGNADTQIEKNETALLSLYDKLQAQSLAVDEPRLKEIINSYQNNIEEMAKKVQEDPLAFRKEIGNIRQLSRKINDDWTKGEVAAIQGNKQTRDAWVKDHLEKAKKEKGYVTQDDITYANSVFDKQFNEKGGTKYDNGKYNSYTSENLNPFVNLEDLGEERAKGYIADVVTKNGVYTDGKYMYTSEKKNEVVPFETVKQGVLSSMINDKELMAYYGQQVRLGRYTQDEVAQKLESSANRVAEKYSYKKEEYGNKSTTGDPYALENLRQSHRIALEDYKDKLKNEGLITGPGENVLWATKEQQLEWDRKSITQLNELAKASGIRINSTDPIKVVAAMKKIYNNQLTLAKKSRKSQKVIDVINNNLSQLNNIDGFHNNGRGVASWTGMAEGITLLSNGRYDGTKIAANTKKSLEAYSKNGAMNNVPFSMEINGKMVKTTINKLLKEGKISNEKDVVISNSFMPTWNNLNPNKQHLNQVDFKIKLKGNSTGNFDSNGNEVFNTEVVPVKSTFSDFELNFYQ